MTYDLEHYRKYAPLEFLPGMPSGPDMIDTSGMRAVLPALIARICTMLNPAGVERGALSRLWEARRMFISVYRAEVYNLMRWLINTMQGDKAWQRQVREDLGGEAALLRWDKRYAKIMAGDAPAPRTTSLSNREKAGRKRRKILTDRYNMFCLAKITKAATRKSAYKAPLFTPLRNAAIRVAPLKPIPLTPDQLRVPMTCKADDSAAHQTHVCKDVTAPSGASQNMPKLTRADIMKARDTVFHYYGLFNLNIMHLDVEITLELIRRRTVPT